MVQNRRNSLLGVQRLFVEWRLLKRIKKSETMENDYFLSISMIWRMCFSLPRNSRRTHRQHFEIDHLLLTHQGIVLIETKNIRGTIISRRNGWCQIKRSEAGKSWANENSRVQSIK